MELGQIVEPESNVWDDTSFKAAVIMASVLTFIVTFTMVVWVCCVYQRHYDKETDRLTKVLLLKEGPRGHHLYGGKQYYAP